MGTEQQGELETKEERRVEQLVRLEELQDQRAITEDELLQKVQLSMEFEEVSGNEEIAWRQRSRVQWLNFGDRKTKYFHRIATTHKRLNSIEKLEVEGAEVTDSEEIKKEIVSFYQKLYKETEQRRPTFNIQEAESIHMEEKEQLQRQFEEAKVLEVIKMCATDKAPGPDGFPMSFYQNFWELIKEDVMNTIRHFHEYQVFEKSLNATYVALIPKKTGCRTQRFQTNKKVV